MDNESRLQQQVLDAYGGERPLVIRGGGSKDFYGYPVQGESLDMSTHTGIIDYQPAELVLTARAGTPLREIESVLSEHNQMLGCEPPHFADSTTFGGMIAAGLSGPRRPFAGSIADRLLGCKILNGRGETMNFGGKVMKNVAGYDLSRLMAGSMGCLAVILEATVRLSPTPRAERTFHFHVKQERVTPFINDLVASGFPVSASCHDNLRLTVRFSAGEREIAGIDEALKRQFDAVTVEEEIQADYWLELREQRSAFFINGGGNIWRLSMAPNTELDLPGETLVEWNGALRWLKTEIPPAVVFDSLSNANGSAALFRHSHSEITGQLFQPLSAPLLNWHRQLKNTFDPLAVFNRGRMYREL